MADRDVKLIIRAKNEASRAIDSVSEALKDLNQSQEETGRSAAKADGLLGELGAEFQRLNKEVAGLNALGKVATEIQKVERAVERVQSDTRSSAAEFAKYAREAEKASAATAKLSAQSSQFRDAVSREEALLKNLRAERSRANAELRKSESQYKSLQAAIERQGRAGTPAAKSAETFLAADVAKARAAVDGTVRALNEQKSATDRAKQALKDHSAELRRSEGEERRLAAAAKGAAAATTQNRTELQRSRAALGEVRQAATTAAQALGGVAISQREIGEASRQTAATLDAVGSELRAMQRFSDGGGGFTNPQTADAIRRQREEVERARAAYELLEARSQRLAAAQQRIGPPTRTAATAQREAAAAAKAAKEEMERQIAVLNRMPGAINQVRGLRGIFAGLYGESRQAMSLFQRLRGEVLSLSTAYVGLYGTIQNVGGVITAYQSLEAAQNRLGAVFNQNDTAVRNELAWLERQASRLGISFDTLSNQYSKFSVAAKAANYESEATRKIFLSVAEAGRVNKLSLDQMGGIFLALEQMISKGKIQSEELRRQLGDRLPGAFNIMADALGIATSELDDMMKAGEVLASQTNLLKFADQLDQRFGPQLATSLRSTTTEIGKFQNELFQAQLRVARGGFIDALTEGLRELNQWFQSREGRDFFLSLGSALGDFVSALAVLPRHIDLITAGFRLLISLKLARWIAGLATSMTGQLAPAMAGMVLQLGVARNGLAGFRAALASLGVVVGSVGSLLKTFLPLAVFTAATYFVQSWAMSWVGGIDDATRAADEHERIMNHVIAAYEEVGSKASDWAKQIKEVTADQASANLRSAIEAYEEAISEFGATVTTRFDALDYRAEPGIRELQRMQLEVRKGQMTLRDFIVEAEKLYKTFENDKAKRFAEELLAAARDSEKFEVRLRQAAFVAEKYGVSMEEAQRIIDLFGGSLEEMLKPLDTSSNSMDKAAEATSRYAAALDALKEKIPGLADELKKLEGLAEVADAFESGARAIMDMNEPFEMRVARRSALSNARDQALQAEILKGVTDSIRESVKLLVSKEGFRSEPYWDVNAWRVGFGSDTVTLDDGSIRKVTQGMQVTQLDAYRDLTRRIGEFQDGIIREIGPSAFGAFTPQQQAVLTSLVYNYGSGEFNERGDLASVVKAIKGGGSIEQIAEAIRALGSHNQGANRQRRADEADMFLGSQTGAQGYEWEKKKTDELKKQNEERAKEQAATSKQLADLGFQIEQQKLITDGRGREAAIEEAIRQAKEQNKNITEDQIAQVAELTGRLYDLQNAQSGVEAAEKRVNDLLQMRQELTEQIKLHQEMGQGSQAQALMTQLQGINAELEAAINNAIAMHQALGGPGADLAIAKLNTTKLSIANVGRQAVISGEMIADRLSGAITNAFRAMAQAIANGEDAWEAFSTAFLQGIAEMLIEIGQLIIKQMILNALQGFLGGMGGGGGLLSGLLRHDGGPVGAGGHHRAVSPAWFAGAVRLHEGGVAGLRPNEVPAILEKGEVVDPGDGSVFRKMFGGEQQAPSVKIVNAFDSGDVVSEGLNSAVGEQTFLNVVRRNAGKVRQMLGQ